MREMVGHAGFHGPPETDDLRKQPKLELGYAVFSAFRGRGFGIEAGRALIAWAARTHAIDTSSLPSLPTTSRRSPL
jgi:RimJ/RimL family protein N-acetyltransferase